ncbi:MAG: ribonuclease E/G [Rhodospirillales bacterium]|nr:ribonuclease E/G [Rhodospirillales bacterium]
MEEGILDILIEELEGSLWTAALKDGRLEGLEVDPPYEEVRWGSIYWAKVKTIDKALDAVFLDLDSDNTGILYNSDVRWIDEKGKIHKGGTESIGQRFQPGDMIAVQAKTAYISSERDDFTPAENKTPQMSMDITLPGRYLVFCAYMDCNRISQRIRDKKLRKQLHKMMDNMVDIQGCILRLAAAHTQSDVLIREGRILKGAWEEIQKYFEGDKPGLIALGPDAIQRTLSDQAGQSIDHIEVVTMEHFNHIEEWCSIFAPDLVTKIEPIELDNATDDLALFHYRDIIGQIEDLFHPYAILPGGGNIIVQDTAALTAIDVNKGGSHVSNLGVNIQAAKEAARQIRLRNCGGIIVIDFLKSQNRKDQGELIAALEKAIDEDPCTVQIHGITALGLIELTRKRRTPPLADRFQGMLVE